jgi:hypothetical protein
VGETTTNELALLSASRAREEVSRPVGLLSAWAGTGLRCCGADRLEIQGGPVDFGGEVSAQQQVKGFSY